MSCKIEKVLELVPGGTWERERGGLILTVGLRAMQNPWFTSVSLLSSVQSLSRVWLFATPWTAARQASLSITNSQSLLRLMSIESVMPSNHLILCHSLLLMWISSQYLYFSKTKKTELELIFSSVQFSRSVMSNSLRPHGLQHTRPPCPSPTPRVYSDSCPLSRWYYPTISSSVIPFSSCLN